MIRKTRMSMHIGGKVEEADQIPVRPQQRRLWMSRMPRQLNLQMRLRKSLQLGQRSRRCLKRALVLLPATSLQWKQRIPRTKQNEETTYNSNEADAKVVNLYILLFFILIELCNMYGLHDIDLSREICGTLLCVLEVNMRLHDCVSVH